MNINLSYIFKLAELLVPELNSLEIMFTFSALDVHFQKTLNAKRIPDIALCAFNDNLYEFFCKFNFKFFVKFL